MIYEHLRKYVLNRELKRVNLLIDAYKKVVVTGESSDVRASAMVHYYRLQDQQETLEQLLNRRV